MYPAAHSANPVRTVTYFSHLPSPAFQGTSPFSLLPLSRYLSLLPLLHWITSFQNFSVRSATASSLSSCITRALPHWASGPRGSGSARRLSAPAGAAGSAGGTIAPASPIASGVATTPVPTTATSCAIASATTWADCSTHPGSARDGCTSTSSSAHTRGSCSGGSAPVQRTRAASRSSLAIRSSRSRSGPSPTTHRCQRALRFSASARNKVSSPFSGTKRPTYPIASPSCSACSNVVGTCTPSCGSTATGRSGTVLRSRAAAPALPAIAPLSRRSARRRRARGNHASGTSTVCSVNRYTETV